MFTFFLFLILNVQSLLETNCATHVLSQLDEQRQRGRTLTQADIVRHCFIVILQSFENFGPELNFIVYLSSG